MGEGNNMIGLSHKLKACDGSNIEEDRGVGFSRQQNALSSLFQR